MASELREGIAGSDRRQLPVTRVQLRWAEASLAAWRGQLELAERLIGRAYDLHLQTELYAAEVSFLAAYLSLLWDRGQVATAPDAIGRSSEPLVWAAVAAAETGDIEKGQQLLRQRLKDLGPDYWYTLGHMTVLAHAATDLADRDSAQILLDWLEPKTPYIATIGQTGSLGPVALATARLRHLLGDDAGAKQDLITAERLASDGAGPSALLRTRLASALLEAPSASRTGILLELSEQADRLGLAGVAATARREATGSHATKRHRTDPSPTQAAH